MKKKNVFLNLMVTVILYCLFSLPVSATSLDLTELKANKTGEIDIIL